MKKLFLLLIAVVMLLPAIAGADLPDISSLSDEELIELNHQIQQRLFSQKLIDGVNVPAGEYIVGEDIPAGIYHLIIMFPDSGGYLTIYESVENKMEVNSSFLGKFWGVTEIGKIELLEGNIVDISGNTLCFKPYVGLFD